MNNARADKLDGFMWRYSFTERRCLVPVTEFAEAEGEKGSKTRAWFRKPNQEVFACAGIWRDTLEWGPAYSMFMTEACIHVAAVQRAASSRAASARNAAQRLARRTEDEELHPA